MYSYIDSHSILFSQLVYQKYMYLTVFVLEKDAMRALTYINQLAAIKCH